MIKVFHGENRLQAEKAIVEYLGRDYETIEGDNLTLADLPNIFWGTSLLGSSQAFLIKDILSNKAIANEIPTYLDTNYKVAIWETKIDTRSSIYKILKNKVEIVKFEMPKDYRAFDVCRMAKKNGRKAVEMLREIEPTEDPIAFAGLMVSQAIKEYKAYPGKKEKAAFKELSRLDMQLKSSKLQPWTIIEAFLTKMSI